MREDNGRGGLIGATSRLGGKGPTCEGASVCTSTASYLPWLEKTTGLDLG